MLGDDEGCRGSRIALSHLGHERFQSAMTNWIITFIVFMDLLITFGQFYFPFPLFLQ